ncbi:MAG: VanZ family protein [Burkholderiaceae bacterium]
MKPRVAIKSWPPRSSRTVRLLGLACAILIVFASLTPWAGWRDLGVAPWAWADAPWPRYFTVFDVSVNVIGYLPLGFLVVLALHPRVRGAAALILALLAGALLSGAVESAQTWLPARVPSNLDWCANTAGALLGALMALPIASPLIDRGRLAQLRARWFEPNAQAALLLVGLWPLAQIYPEPMLFANGHWLDSAQALVSALGGRLESLQLTRFGPAEYVLAEAVIVTSAVLAAGLLTASAMRPAAPRLPLLVGVVLAALVVRTLAAGEQFGADRALIWLTPGAIGGLVLGGLALAAAAFGPTRWLPRLGLLAMLVLVGAVNAVPENPYYAVTLQAWRPGRTTHFYAVAHWLSTAWPYAAALWLAWASVVRRPLSRSL